MKGSMTMKKLSSVFIIIGLLFILNAIFGRYLVLPGYLASLEQGQSTVESVSQTVSAWKIIRYLLWAYSFKLGIYFIILGAVTKIEMLSSRIWVFAIGGFLYIAFAYIPLPAPGSLIFGITGGMMTLLMILIFLGWPNQYKENSSNMQRASDYRLAGFFFFAMATYTICPLLGVKAFALSPEKMIGFGLQADAISLAFHLLIELALGWLFTFLGYQKEKI